MFAYNDSSVRVAMTGVSVRTRSVGAMQASAEGRRRSCDDEGSKKGGEQQQ